MAAEVSVPAVSSKWPPLKREPRGPAREWTPDPNKVWTPPPPPKIHVDGYLWPICNLNKPTQLRFLVSHSEAKRLSREHMSNGRDSQFHMFGACAQLSAPDELFPGISARIVMVSGDFNGTSLTVDWLLVFLRSHLRYTDNISLIVPDRFCHVLTGNEGNTLKTIIEKSLTEVVVAPPNRYVVGLDRLVTVLASASGTLWRQRRAVRFILSKLTEEPCYPLDLESPYSYAGLKTKQTQIRFLVSPTLAETITLHYRSKRNELEFSLWGAHISLSREHEVFPGRSDRIVMVSGTCYNITMAVLGLSKLLKERPYTTKISLIIPDKSCDALCGEGGASLKLIMERSKAVIHVSPQDHNYIGLDRLVTVSGSGLDYYEIQMDAVHSILSKLTDDVCYPSHLESPFTYADIECVRQYDRKNTSNDKPMVTCKYDHHKTIEKETQDQATINKICDTSSQNLSRNSEVYASVYGSTKDASDSEVKYRDDYTDEDLGSTITKDNNREVEESPKMLNSDVLLIFETLVPGLMNGHGSFQKYPDSKCVSPFDQKMKNTRNDQPKVTCTNDFRKIKTSEEEAKNQSTIFNENRQMYGSAKAALDVRRAEHISRRSRSGSDLLSTERSALSLIDENTSPWKYTDSKCVNQFDKKMKNTRNDQSKVTCANDFRKIKASEEEAKNQSTECKENRQMYRSAKVALDVRRAEHISRRSRSGSDLLSTERSALSLIDGNTYTGAVLRDPPVVPGLRDNSKRRDLVAW